MYSKEDCGRNDPSMSPGSRSGRGAMTLTPAPNGAEAFNIANRTSESWQRKMFFLPRGDLNTVPKLGRTGVRPLGQAAYALLSLSTCLLSSFAVNKDIVSCFHSALPSYAVDTIILLLLLSANMRITESRTQKTRSVQIVHASHALSL